MAAIDGKWEVAVHTPFGDMKNILEVKDLHVDIGMHEGTLTPVRGVSFEIKKPSQIHVKGKSSSEDTLDDVSDEEAKDAEKTVLKDANIIGTMVHKLMEVLVTSGNKVDIKKLIEEILKEFVYYDEAAARKILEAKERINRE